jgi:hypothetical protein
MQVSLHAPGTRHEHWDGQHEEQRRRRRRDGLTHAAPKGLHAQRLFGSGLRRALNAENMVAYYAGYCGSTRR